MQQYALVRCSKFYRDVGQTSKNVVTALDGQAVLVGSPIWSQAFDDRSRQ
jgi:hypothetical protein